MQKKSVQKRLMHSFFGLIFFMLFLPINSLQAEVGISLGSGLGLRQIIPLRVGLQKGFDVQWCATQNWSFGGYFELSYYALRGKRGLPIQNKRLTAVAFAPVFRFEKNDPTSFGWPYFELGFGVSRLSKKEICGRELGIHFQFEDRAGIGLRLGENRALDISYKFIHFSNAFLGPRNNGIDLHTIIVGYWF